MKKFLFALLMAASFAANAAGTASFAVEAEHEAIEGSGDDVNSLSFIPGYKFENGIKLDVKLTGKQADDSNSTSVAFEPRVKYMFPINETFALGGRVSLGESLSNGGDYAFYTIEPIAEWAFANRWLANVSFKYKDPLSNNHGVQSETLYLGAGYKVTDAQTVSAKVYTRNNQGPVADSNGIEVNYSIAF